MLIVQFTWGCQEPEEDCREESTEQGLFLWLHLKIRKVMVCLELGNVLPLCLNWFWYLFLSWNGIFIQGKIWLIWQIYKTYIQQVFLVGILLIFNCTKHICGVKFYFFGVAESKFIQIMKKFITKYPLIERHELMLWAFRFFPCSFS